MIHYLQSSGARKKLLDKGFGPCGNEHGQIGCDKLGGIGTSMWGAKKV